MAPQIRVLVIEDEPAFRENLGRILRHAGHEAALAADGEAGLGRLAEGGIDVVLLDLGLPRLCGSEVLERIRALHPDIPAVIVSGRASVDEARALLERGAFDYLLKPCSALTVLDTIHAAHLAARTDPEPGTDDKQRSDA